MDYLISYFNSIPSLHRTIILFGGLTFFLLLENGIPFFRFKYNKLKHLGLNLFFTFTTILVNFIMAFLLINLSIYCTENQFGLLQLSFFNPLAVFIVGLLLMDFLSAWLAHFTEHKIKWLWQFHLIHHTDQYVDASTANRHHPGESVIRFIFTLLATLILGAPIWLIMVYQALSATLSQFNHSNIKLPVSVENVLMLIICTPQMHRVHHHYRQPYSDSNYGNIFSFWDRIFGTFVKVDNAKLVYGLDTHMEVNEASSIINLLKAPFKAHRPHIEYETEEKL